jgi:hypothetical protein
MPRFRPSFSPDTGDVPAGAAARRLGISEAAFREKLPQLLAAGFPPANPITGNWSVEAIDAWRLRPHADLLGLTAGAAARDARSLDVRERIARAVGR